MKVLKTAVVGLGRIGWQTHIPGVRTHAGFELVAVVDPLQERLEEARSEFGVKGYTTLASLLEQEELDLIVIASPTHLHAEQACATMACGIDVFCDKPIAPTLAEADRMIDAMRRTGRKLMIFQPHRATQETAALRHILDQDLLGPIFLIKHAVACYARRNDWQSQRQFGGGMLNNYGAHYLDQLLYLTRSHAVKIACHLRAIATLGDADDVVKALIEMANGTLIDLEINMASSLPQPAWYVHGQRGTAKLADDGAAFQVRYYTSDDLSDLQLNTELAAAARSYDNFERISWRETTVPLADFAITEYYEKCYDYFALNQAPYVPVEETREVMRVIAECRKDAGWE